MSIFHESNAGMVPGARMRTFLPGKPCAGMVLLEELTKPTILSTRLLLTPMAPSTSWSCSATYTEHKRAEEDDATE